MILQPPLNPVELIQATVHVQVVEEEGTPATQAQLQLNGLQGWSDLNGLSVFRKVLFPKTGTTITIDQPGYFRHYHHLLTPPFANTTTTAQLFRRPSETISGAGELQAGNGARLRFSSGAFLTGDKEAYQGVVDISARWLSEEEDEARRPFNQAPAIDNKGDTVFLLQYGIFLIEASATNGNGIPLLISSQQPLQLHFSLSSSSLPATSEIPLWVFYPSEGIWQERSHAVRQGGTYTAAIDTLLPWVAGVPAPMVDGALNLWEESPDGGFLAVPHTSMEFKSARTGSTLFESVSDDKGRLRYHLPGEIPLRVRIKTACGERNLELDPLEEGVGPGRINLKAISGPQLLTFHFKNCDGALIKAGYVSYGQEESLRIAPLDSDGRASLFLSGCGNEPASLRVYDSDQNQWTASLNSPAWTSLSDTVQFCVPSSSLSFKADGNTFQFNRCQASIIEDPGGDRIHIRAFNEPFILGSDIVDFFLLRSGPEKASLHELSYRIRTLGSQVIRNGPELAGIQVSMSAGAGLVTGQFAGQIRGQEPVSIGIEVDFVAQRIQ